MQYLSSHAGTQVVVAPPGEGELDDAGRPIGYYEAAMGVTPDAVKPLLITPAEKAFRDLLGILLEQAPDEETCGIDQHHRLLIGGGLGPPPDSGGGGPGPKKTPFGGGIQGPAGGGGVTQGPTVGISADQSRKRLLPGSRAS